MLPLTKEELKLYEDAKECYIWEEFSKKILLKIKITAELENIAIIEVNRGAAHSICNLKFDVPNEIPVVFHRRSNYDYQFIIKELANEFDSQFECFGKNKEIYKTFFVPIEKEVIKISKDGNESVESICYKIKFINSSRFMAILLSNLFANLTERIHQIKFGCSVEHENVKNNLIKYKCVSCDKKYPKKLNEEFEKKYKSTFKFSNNDSNKFILFLRKGADPYEYMDDWKKFDETALPEKDEFHINLNTENITDIVYTHAKRVCKNFEIKNLSEYHELYLKSDVLLLADIFENVKKYVFRNL